MRLALLALVFLLALPASGQAAADGGGCDDEGLHHVAVLRVQEADGTVRGEVRTGVPYPPCSRPPDAAFSGRWVAYRDPGGVHVVDWTAGEAWGRPGSLADAIGPHQAFGLQNDTLVALDAASGVADWLDLATGASGSMQGLEGHELFGGMAVAVREGHLAFADVRLGGFVGSAPVEGLAVTPRRVLSSNAAYTVVYDNATGGVGLVHHATGDSRLLVRYEGVSAAYLDDGHVAVELGPSRFAPWGQEPAAVYREPFDDGPTQVVQAGGCLWGHSKGLYLVVAREAVPEPTPSPSPSVPRTPTPTTPAGDPSSPSTATGGDQVLEVPSAGAALAALALGLAALRRR